MNANAGEWRPTTASPPAPPAPAPTPTPSASDGIDESDPLWQLVLTKICEGDRDRATKLIDNPEGLLAYPEVAALIAAGEGSGAAAMEEEEEEWEKAEVGGGGGGVAEGGGALAELADEVEAMAIEDAGTGPTTAAAVVKAPAVATIEADPREHLNLVFIGHVDAGKSTLSGNILYITENVDRRTIEKYEQEAKALNRESWFLAFIMDTNEEERAKGKTVEVGRAAFDTDVHRYSILDAPGHKNYVPNMIMGASQADVGVLVISARKGEFESGFDKGGQTREHALLAKTLGVSHLVVVINKMDDPTVGWAKERYDECVTKLRPFLKTQGFKIKKEVKFMPISGLKGANIKDEVDPKDCSWWAPSWKSGANNTSSPTLLSLLDSLKMQGRDAEAPLRIPVLDRYTDRGTIAMGKVESGTIRPGMKITLMPTRQQYKVDGVWKDETPLTHARPGENILVKLSGANIEDVHKGFVICSNPPCRSVAKLICRIMVMDLPEQCGILTAGFKANFHAHCAEEEATVTNIFEVTDVKGRVTKGARFATVGQSAICMIELARTVPCETYDDYPFLGRFTLRTEGKTCAIGVIQKLPPKKE